MTEGDRQFDGSDALIEGQLELEDNCLYVGSRGPDERYPVIWPHGTSWNDAETAVELRDWTLVRDGNRVSGGDGCAHVTDLDRFTGAEGQALAQERVDDTHDETAAFNSGADIEVHP